jgi:hypothetical protein
MLASISIVRSVDTANVIAGNLAFKQTTVQAADFGIEAAVAALPFIAATSAETDLLPDPGAAPPYWYYASRRDADASGVPTTRAAGAPGAATATPIDWNDVPVATTVAGNAVQIVIDRLCLGPTPVDIQTQCFFERNADGSSRKPGPPGFDAVTAVHYRVTARVTGPRNTVSIVQAILSR